MEKESYKKYRQKCSNLSKKNIELREGLTVDHIFPCRKGYDMGIPVEIISDKRNLQLISLKDNIKKLDQTDGIPKFIQDWLLGKLDEIRIKDTREKQLEGIKRAKELKIYTGRKKGSVEDREKFLEKHQENIKLILEGRKHTEISKMTGTHINTLTKIKKIIFEHE